MSCSFHVSREIRACEDINRQFGSEVSKAYAAGSVASFRFEGQAQSRLGSCWYDIGKEDLVSHGFSWTRLHNGSERLPPLSRQGAMYASKLAMRGETATYVCDEFGSDKYSVNVLKPNLDTGKVQCITYYYDKDPINGAFQKAELEKFLGKLPKEGDASKAPVTQQNIDMAAAAVTGNKYQSVKAYEIEVKKSAEQIAAEIEKIGVKAYLQGLDTEQTPHTKNLIVTTAYKMTGAVSFDETPPGSWRTLQISLQKAFETPNLVSQITQWVTAAQAEAKMTYTPYSQWRETPQSVAPFENVTYARPLNPTFLNNFPVGSQPHALMEISSPPASSVTKVVENISGIAALTTHSSRPHQEVSGFPVAFVERRVSEHSSAAGSDSAGEHNFFKAVSPLVASGGRATLLSGDERHEGGEGRALHKAASSLAASIEKAPLLSGHERLEIDGGRAAHKFEARIVTLDIASAVYKASSAVYETKGDVSATQQTFLLKRSAQADTPHNIISERKSQNWTSLSPENGASRHRDNLKTRESTVWFDPVRSTPVKFYTNQRGHDWQGEYHRTSPSMLLPQRPAAPANKTTLTQVALREQLLLERLNKKLIQLATKQALSSPIPEVYRALLRDQKGAVALRQLGEQLLQKLINQQREAQQLSLNTLRSLRRILHSSLESNVQKMWPHLSLERQNLLIRLTERRTLRSWLALLRLDPSELNQDVGQRLLGTAIARGFLYRKLLLNAGRFTEARRFSGLLLSLVEEWQVTGNSTLLQELALDESDWMRSIAEGRRQKTQRDKRNNITPAALTGRMQKRDTRISQNEDALLKEIAELTEQLGEVRADKSKQASKASSALQTSVAEAPVNYLVQEQSKQIDNESLEPSDIYSFAEELEKRSALHSKHTKVA